MHGQRSGVPDAPSFGVCDRCEAQSILDDDTGYCHACVKLDASEAVAAAEAAMTVVRLSIRGALASVHPDDILDALEDEYIALDRSGFAWADRLERLHARMWAASGRGEES